MTDQAAALREIVQSRIAPCPPSHQGCQVLAVTSGKGGVGKTNLTVNLAIALRRGGLRVAVLDADFGLANIDVFLGLTPSHHLGHVVEGLVPMSAIVMEGPEDIHVIPASSGIRELADMGEVRRNELLNQLQDVLSDYDYLLIDTAAGIGENVMELLRYSRQVVVVLVPEPTAIVDAYALIKVLVQGDRKKEIAVVINSVDNGDEAREVFGQLARVAQRFLGRSLSMLGFVLKDDSVHQAVVRQVPLMVGYPTSAAGRCVGRIARRLLQTPRRVQIGNEEWGK